MHNSDILINDFGVHFFNGQYENFESFEKENLFLMIMGGELWFIYSETVKSGPVSYRNEKETSHTIIHLDWCLQCWKCFVEVFEEAWVLRDVNTIRLFWVIFICLTNKRSPLFYPFWGHIGTTHQNEGLAEVSHGMCEFLSGGRIMVMVSSNNLIRPLFFGVVKDSCKCPGKRSKLLNKSIVHSPTSSMKIHVKRWLTRIEIEYEACRFIFKVIKLASKWFVCILDVGQVH